MMDTEEFVGMLIGICLAFGLLGVGVVFFG